MLFIPLSLSLIVFGCSGEEPAEQGNAGRPAPPVQSAVSEAETIGIGDLASWPFYGLGEVRVDEGENALFMTEFDGSKGVMIVSPKSYGKNVTVTFKVKPVTVATVNVVMLSVSDKNTGGAVTIPADYDGNFGFWTAGDVQDYIFAFHNGAHDRKPFITKNPGSELLVEAEAHATGERWHDVEIGRAGIKLWMKVDGKTVVEATDPSPSGLPGGAVCFRLRGTPDAVASALFRDVVIEEGE